MKNKNIFFINIIFMIEVIVGVLIVFVATKEIIPIINENERKTRIFSDMEEKKDDVIRGIVGIVSENNLNGLANHNGIGCGVIFDKNDKTYYVVTAKHVVNAENNNYKIFTKDTEFKGQNIEIDSDANFEIPDEEYYESLLDSKIEYISDTADLAILSFEYDGDLTILNFESDKLSKGDKIMVIGHPEGNRYKTTYGYIKSGIRDFEGYKVIGHDAYMKQGNSGGAALTKNMKIAGINVASSYTLFRHYRIGYMIPYDVVEYNIETWRNR